MTMRSWLSNLFARPATRTSRKAPRRARLGVEGLEDRCLLTAGAQASPSSQLAHTLRASVHPTSAHIAIPPVCCGHIDRRFEGHVVRATGWTGGMHAALQISTRLNCPHHAYMYAARDHRSSNGTLSLGYVENLRLCVGHVSDRRAQAAVDAVRRPLCIMVPNKPGLLLVYRKGEIVRHSPVSGRPRCDLVCHGSLWRGTIHARSEGSTR